MFRRFMFAFMLSGFSMVAVAEAADLRTWTDSTGKFSLQAKFVSHTNGQVTLEKADGSRFEIPLAKLSAADKKYVSEYKMQEESPFQPKQAMPGGNGQGVGNGELTVFSTADVIKVPILSPGAEWKLSVPQAASAKLSDRAVALPARSDFWERSSGAAVNVSGTRAVVGFSSQKPGNNDSGTSRFVLADLETGKSIMTPSVPLPLSLLAVAENGTDVLVKRTQFGWSKPGRVELYSLSADGAKRGLAWTPHADEPIGPNQDILWGGFLAADKVATMSSGGTFTVWDTTAKKALYTIATGVKAAPAVAPGGKQIALIMQHDVMVIDSTDGRILALKNLGNQVLSAVAYSPTGSRLAVIAMQNVVAMNTATGEVFCEMPIPFGIGTMIFTDEDRLLIGTNLYDLETKTALWSYSGGETPFSAGGRTWFVTSASNSTGALVPLTLPHPAAAAMLKQAAQDPNFYVLKPGSTVKLDVSQIPDDQREKVTSALTARLQANEMTVDPRSPITLSAWTTQGKQHEVNYRSIGFPRGPGGPFGNSKTYKVREFFTQIRFTLDGKNLYETKAGGLPHLMRLKEGETVEKVLKTYEKPNYDAFGNMALPKRLTKTQGNRPTFGASRITPTGVR